MATTAPVSTDDLKLKLKEVLSKWIVETIADRSQPYAKIREMAVAVTDSLPNVSTNEDLSVFLEEILEDYPFLKNEIVVMRNEVGRQKEQMVMDKLKSYISNFSTK